MQNDNQITNQNFLGEYFGQVRQTLIHLFAWAGFVVLSVYLAGDVSIIPGFLFGFGASTVYYILMFLRIKKSSAMSISKAVTYMRIGWIIRLTFLLAVLIIALKVPWLDFKAAVLGVLSFQLVLFAQAIVIATAGTLRKYKNK